MVNHITPETVEFYQDATGNEPFAKWIDSFRDSKTRRRILQRIYRMEIGNYGDYKPLKDGVKEYLNNA